MTDSTTSFLLSRSSRTVRGTGTVARYDSVTAAQAAIAGGAPVVGLLGFDTAGPAALLTPGELVVDGAPVAARAFDPSTSSGSESKSSGSERSANERSGSGSSKSGGTGSGGTGSPMTTAPEVHRDRVVHALAAIAAGRAAKVVLARTMELTYDEPLDPGTLAASFAAGAGGATVFAARGPGERWLIGASPELLVRKQGRIVTCHPYAGSAARSADPAVDAAAAASLEASDKDLREHAFVVDDLRTRLTPLCAELSAPATPALMSTGEMWHLATPIRGVLRDDSSLTALDLAALLSPTPAVCGTPRSAAAQLIAELEGPREFYGGAVGWCDANGDGEWLVSIRCLELSENHRSIRTWAGGGIVAGSDPDAEVAETDAKFRTVRRALGLPG